MTTSTDMGGAIPSFERFDRMTKARNYAGFTQATLAGQLGISQRSVSNYESGLRSPSRAVLIAWAFATGVNLHWLETGHDHEGPDGGGNASDQADAQILRSVACAA